MFVERPPGERERLAAGWMEFLGKQCFDAWGTGTFRVPAHSGVAALKRGSSVIRRYLRKHDAAVWFFIVAEPFQLGSYHVHFMLMGMRDKVKSKELLRGLKEQFERSAGFSRVQDIAEPEAVRVYVSKYLTKLNPDFQFVGKRPGHA